MKLEQDAILAVSIGTWVGFHFGNVKKFETFLSENQLFAWIPRDFLESSTIRHPFRAPNLD